MYPGATRNDRPFGIMSTACLYTCMSNIYKKKVHQGSCMVLTNFQVVGGQIMYWPCYYVVTVWPKLSIFANYAVSSHIHYIIINISQDKFFCRLEKVSCSCKLDHVYIPIFPSIIRNNSRWCIYYDPAHSYNQCL